MYDVITIGSTTRDAFLKSPDFQTIEDPRFRTGRGGCFALGSKFDLPEVTITSGGGGTNSAVTFARQGFKTACIGIVGDDGSGREIIEELKKENIDPIFHIDKEHDTAYSTILVSGDGERTILEYRGTSDFINEKNIDFDNLKSKWIYIDSLSDNFNLLEKILEWSEKNKIKTAFNPGKTMINAGPDKLHRFLDKIDIFIANEDESAYITGIEYAKGKENEIFAKMDEMVRGIVVMSKGPRGVEVSDGKNHYTAGIPDSPVIDRTGAGDSFGSGFVSGYIQSNGDIEYAIQLGTANATSVVKYFGGKKGILKKGDWGDYPRVNVKKI